VHKSWEEIKRFLQEQEEAIQPVFDVCLFIDTFEHYFAA